MDAEVDGARSDAFAGCAVASARSGATVLGADCDRDDERESGRSSRRVAGGTDLSRWSAQEIYAVANALNTRPRKTLGWMTPAEALNEYLKSSQQPSVATTG